MAGTEEKLEAFFKQYIKIPGRQAIITRELPSLKQSMMVNAMLDQMMSSGVIGDYEKAQITGQGEGTVIGHDQAGKLLDILKRKDGYLYIRFLMILKEHQRDLARTLTGAYFDLLSLDDLEKRFENSPATLNKQPEPSAPMAKESGKDYAGYMKDYIDKEGREKILLENYQHVSKFLQPDDILPAMVSKKVITPDQKATIEENVTRNKQAQALQGMLLGMDDDKYVAFLDVLFTNQKNINKKLTGGKYIPGEELRRNVDL